MAYNGALGKYHSQRNVTALDVLDDAATNMETYNSTWGGNPTWEKSAWDLQLMTGLGLTANSDIVSLYLEPELGLQIVQAGSSTDKNAKEVYGLGWNVYAEIYITPLKNLEWYFEASIGNALKTVSSYNTVDLATTTGITWYLPAL